MVRDKCAHHALDDRYQTRPPLSMFEPINDEEAYCNEAANLTLIRLITGDYPHL
jgi:hypothetical protein